MPTGAQMFSHLVGLKVDRRGFAVWFAGRRRRRRRKREQEREREAKWGKHEALSRETYAAVDSRIKEWPPEKKIREKRIPKEWKNGKRKQDQLLNAWPTHSRSAIVFESESDTHFASFAFLDFLLATSTNIKSIRKSFPKWCVWSYDKDLMALYL